MESEHFKDAELRCPHCGLNNCTGRLLVALETLRTNIGKPINILSACRCPIHNIEVGGVRDSFHVSGEAADICVDGMAVHELARAATSVNAIKGVGRNDFGHSVHVDVRPAPVARWCYNHQGEPIEWYA